MRNNVVIDTERDLNLAEKNFLVDLTTEHRHIIKRMIQSGMTEEQIARECAEVLRQIRQLVPFVERIIRG
jgi:hypothetical protein